MTRKKQKKKVMYLKYRDSVKAGGKNESLAGEIETVLYPPREITSHKWGGGWGGGGWENPLFQNDLMEVRIVFLMASGSRAAKRKKKRCV